MIQNNQEVPILANQIPGNGKNQDQTPNQMPLKLEMHIVYDGQHISVQGPQDPILCMQLISDALEVLANGFSEARKKAAETRIINPGLASVDKRILEEAQNLLKG